MKVKKFDIFVIDRVLLSTNRKISLKDARLRDPFWKKIKEKKDQIKEEMGKINDIYADKDEKGNVAMQMTERGMIPLVSEEKREEYEKEVDALQEETVEIKVPRELSRVIEECDYKPQLGEVEVIDKVFFSFGKKK